MAALCTKGLAKVCCCARRCVESLQDAPGTHVDDKGTAGRDSYDEEA